MSKLNTGRPLSGNKAITAIAALLGLLIALSVRAESPQDWLMRMQDAVEQTSYQGTLLHMTPGNVEQFKVYHRVSAGQRIERLVLMDGAGAEIIRKPDEVICIFPRKRSVVIESRVASLAGGSPLAARLPAVSEVAGKYYDLDFKAEDRIVQRNARIIAITPRDDFRYGYRLWVDLKTAMPLKTQLIGDSPDMPVEEIRFVEIDLDSEVTASSVEPEIDTSSYKVARHGNPSQDSQPDTTDDVLGWSCGDLPAGFMLSASRLEYMEGAPEPRVHLVYSDGLASVSVFVDALAEDTDVSEGPSAMGASSAYSVVRDDLLVTAVGEVPPRTVRRIARAMRVDGPLAE